jgi:hypothetical protein
MSERVLRRLLWGFALLVAPVPILLLGPGLVPTLRLLELAAITLLFGALESAAGVVPLVAAILLGQALLYAAALWLAAWTAARQLRRLGPRVARTVALALVLAGVAVAVSRPIYHTPYASSTSRADLISVYR